MGALRISCAAPPCSVPPGPSRRVRSLRAARRLGGLAEPQIGLDSLCARGLALPPRPCHHMGMDTSTTPHISPCLEPETMTALMLRYIEGQEETAYQYARTLVRRLTADLSVHDALRLARDIVTEVTNDIRIFEEEEEASRIDVALRRLIDRVEAELAD